MLSILVHIEYIQNSKQKKDPSRIYMTGHNPLGGLIRCKGEPYHSLWSKFVILNPSLNSKFQVILPPAIPWLEIENQIRTKAIAD